MQAPPTSRKTSDDEDSLQFIYLKTKRNYCIERNGSEGVVCQDRLNLGSQTWDVTAAQLENGAADDLLPDEPAIDQKTCLHKKVFKKILPQRDAVISGCKKSSSLLRKQKSQRIEESLNRVQKLSMPMAISCRPFIQILTRRMPARLHKARIKLNSRLQPRQV